MVISAAPLPLSTHERVVLCYEQPMRARLDGIIQGQFMARWRRKWCDDSCWKAIAKSPRGPRSLGLLVDWSLEGHAEVTLYESKAS